MLLLEQDTTRTGRVDKLVRQIKFDIRDNNDGEYKVEAIWDSAVYIRELELDHLPNFYYLVSWKRYLKDENTWELVLMV